MSSCHECRLDHEDDRGLWCGMPVEYQRCHFDTFAAYDRAMTIFQKNKNVDYIILAEDRDMIDAGCHCKFQREPDGHIFLCSHTPRFCEEAPFFSRICDYFGKPVHRRSADV